MPPLWRYEVSAVLARAQNAGAITAEKVINFLANIAALNIIVDAEGSNRNLPLASLDGDLKRACLKAGGTLL